MSLSRGVEEFHSGYMFSEIIHLSVARPEFSVSLLNRWDIRNCLQIFS